MDKQLAEEPLVVRLGGFWDSYENLSFKTLGIMTWAYDNAFEHVLKVDDDVFLQLGSLRDWVEAMQGRLQSTYAGQFHYDTPVQSDPSSKWYMADQYSEKTFPPYAFGSCYFVGSQLLQAIVEQRGSLMCYRVEDAGLALWLNYLFPRGSYNIETLHNMMYQTECNNDLAIFTCPVNANEMRELQSNRDGFGSLCGTPNDLFMPEECRVRRCLCKPLTDDDCGATEATKPYEDFIPRMNQEKAEAHTFEK